MHYIMQIKGNQSVSNYAHERKERKTKEPKPKTLNKYKTNSKTLIRSNIISKFFLRKR